MTANQIILHRTSPNNYTAHLAEWYRLPGDQLATAAIFIGFTATRETVTAFINSNSGEALILLDPMCDFLSGNAPECYEWELQIDLTPDQQEIVLNTSNGLLGAIGMSLAQS